jgi:ABC-type branched-subunit amino acid transport system substrate-binding protein
VTTGINNSVILATEPWSTRFHAAHLLLLPPVRQDDSLENGNGAANFDTNREARNAIACAHRHDAFGYIGPCNSGAAVASEPVLNRAGMVQISPSTTNPPLTSPDALIRKAYEPATHARRLAYVTFYRTITTEALTGPSDAAVLKSALRARTSFLVAQQSTYGTSEGGAMEAYAARIGLQLGVWRRRCAESTQPGR